MSIGRRPLFFLVVGLVCLLLVPLTPAGFRWVNYSMFGLALFWGTALSLEELANIRDGKRRDQNTE